MEPQTVEISRVYPQLLKQQFGVGLALYTTVRFFASLLSGYYFSKSYGTVRSVVSYKISTYIWYTMCAKSMVYLQDKGSLYSLVPVLYQLCIPCLVKVEVKEGDCFRIRTQTLYVESRLILPCVCYVKTCP